MKKYTAIVGGKSYEVQIGEDNRVLLNGVPHTVDLKGIDGQSLYSILVDNGSWELLVQANRDEYRVGIGGELHVVLIEDERTRKLEKGMGKTAAPISDVILRAPMPGLVRGVPAQMGEAVKAGQGLIILEAMKMENELRAPRDGMVKEIKVKPGDKVDQGQMLLVLK